MDEIKQKASDAEIEWKEMPTSGLSHGICNALNAFFKGEFIGRIYGPSLRHPNTWQVSTICLDDGTRIQNLDHATAEAAKKEFGMAYRGESPGITPMTNDNKIQPPQFTIKILHGCRVGWNMIEPFDLSNCGTPSMWHVRA